MLLRTFPNEQQVPVITKGEGLYIWTKEGNRLLDMTGGFTAHSTLGWGNKRIISAITSQLERIGHIDYKTFRDENREQLAHELLDNTGHGLDKLFLCGGGGGEACEAALHLSYQTHYEQGNREKQWFISRTQSYHGATTECMALGERPNLEFYRPLFPEKRSKVQEHNKYRHKRSGETDKDYGLRCAQDLEKEILRLGAENVAGFIGETIMGGLVGDVPPTENYWQEVSKVCKKYNVHLILDEVWCGTGITGKMFCVDWDGIRPDFIFMGKTFASGYMPISAVVTSSDVEEVVKKGSGRIENSTTFQGHSAATAAALECVRIIKEDGFLSSVNRKGDRIRSLLKDSLEGHEFFKNVRGRGMRNSLEYECENMNEFGQELSRRMLEKHKVMINGKWHRLTFSNAMTITDEQIELVFSALVDEFKLLSSEWTSDRAKQVELKNYF